MLTKSPGILMKKHSRKPFRKVISMIYENPVREILQITALERRFYSSSTLTGSPVSIDLLHAMVKLTDLNASA